VETTARNANGVRVEFRVKGNSCKTVEVYSVHLTVAFGSKNVIGMITSILRSLWTRKQNVASVSKESDIL
jgi:hypothetical protein